LVLAQPVRVTSSYYGSHPFPSHIGSRSTKTVIGLHMDHGPGFPSHIGSRSTSPKVDRPTDRNVSIPHWFSLNSFCASSKSTLRVSIPLWFSLNLGDARGLPNPLFGFHPTLVLAQRTCLESSSRLPTRFHPTMVLTQQVSSRSWPFGLKRFHPTMVLTQQHRVLLLGRGHGVSIPLWFSLNGLRFFPQPS